MCFALKSRESVVRLYTATHRGTLIPIGLISLPNTHTHTHPSFVLCFCGLCVFSVPLLVSSLQHLAANQGSQILNKYNPAFSLLF